MNTVPTVIRIMVITSLATTGARAQTRSVSVGIVGGLNVSNYASGGSGYTLRCWCLGNPNEYYSTTSTTGITAGGFATISLGKTLAIETGLMYSQRGAQDSTGIYLAWPNIWSPGG